MKEYDKLIRDKIPEIIATDGKKYEIEVMDDEQYKRYLDKKLKEEVEEYLESGEVEELEKVRKDKADKRGAFEKS